MYLPRIAMAIRFRPTKNMMVVIRLAQPAAKSKINSLVTVMPINAKSDSRERRR